MSDNVKPPAEPVERLSIAPDAEPEGDRTQKVLALAERRAELTARATIAPRAKSTAQMVVEGIVDLAAIVGVVVLSALGKLDATFAAVAVAALAGVRITDLAGSRNGGGGPPSAGGLAGAIVGMLAPVLHRGASAAVLGLALVTVAPLAACSASAVHRQAVAASVVAQTANVGLSVVGEIYRAQLREVARAACGYAVPCPDRTARDEAMAAETARWAPVVAVWDLAGAAHAAYTAQLNACQDHDAGPEDAGVCTVQLDVLAGALLAHVTDLRCALRAFGASDPFPGAVSCMLGAKDGGM